MDFEKLYEAYYMQVYSYCITLTRKQELAEEITQNTFFKALSSRSSFRGESEELTWLISIAKNLFNDEMRRQKRTADPDELEDQASEEDIESSVADTDTATRIHMILHKMDEPYKEVFQLRVFGELSFAQIANIFEKSETWARVTYHRAKLKIQERMDQKHE